MLPYPQHPAQEKAVPFPPCNNTHPFKDEVRETSDQRHLPLTGFSPWAVLLPCSAHSA